MSTPGLRELDAACARLDPKRAVNRRANASWHFLRARLAERTTPAIERCLQREGWFPAPVPPVPLAQFPLSLAYVATPSALTVHFSHGYQRARVDAFFEGGQLTLREPIAPAAAGVYAALSALTLPEQHTLLALALFSPGALVSVQRRAIPLAAALLLPAPAQELAWLLAPSFDPFERFIEELWLGATGAVAPVSGALVPGSRP